MFGILSCAILVRMQVKINTVLTAALKGYSWKLRGSIAKPSKTNNKKHIYVWQWIYQLQVWREKDPAKSVKSNLSVRLRLCRWKHKNGRNKFPKRIKQARKRDGPPNNQRIKSDKNKACVRYFFTIQRLNLLKTTKITKKLFNHSCHWNFKVVWDKFRLWRTIYQNKE